MFAKISEKIETYIENKLELVKLDIEERTTVIIVKLVTLVMLMMTGTIFLVFLSMGMAFWINTLLNSPFWGFMIVAGFYMLLFILLYLFKDHKFLRSFSLFNNKT